jgi:hypothetical protein
MNLYQIAPTCESFAKASDVNLFRSIDKEEVASFCAVLREKLLDTSQPFSKEYLQLLVNEIVLTGNSVTVKGGYVPLVGAVRFTAQKKKLSTPQEVLNFNKDWRPRVDSNDRPLIRRGLIHNCLILLALFI